MDSFCPVVEGSTVSAHQCLTLGAILRAFLTALLPLLKLGKHKLRVLWRLAVCGTPALAPIFLLVPTARIGIGRHAPVGTVNSLVLANQRRLYPLLFECAAQSLLEFGRNRLQGDLGITAVLHTWEQKLDFHPHLHCIVTAGALSPDRKQWHSPKQRKFLFPLRALGALFRGKFLAGLAQMLDSAELHLPDSQLTIPASCARWFSLLYSKRWVLYAKRPFGGAQQVLRYLANYTHRVALSNRRIIAFDVQHQSVTFTYRDYRHGSQLKELTLSALEFIRRFSLHILPSGLVRIRHYGILGNNRRKRDIQAARAIFERRGRALELQPQSVPDKPMTCPLCQKPGFRLVAFTDAAGLLHLIGVGPLLCDSS